MRNLPVLALAALCLTAIMVTVNLTRPPLPIDETRYLTVAWEYFARKEWILPTLNFEPYHHKPPFLFWLINLMWHFFDGAEIWSARLVTLIGSLGTLLMTYKIGKTLWPEAPQKAEIAVLMMAATPFFLIYGSLIMFDTLLAVASLSALYALLKIYRGGNAGRYGALLAGALGAGALIKGPVILLHLLPVTLLFPFLVPADAPRLSRKLWFGTFAAALMAGLAIGLAWALPAAKIGGPEYEKMIFWGQSAGRMVKSFDHARPFWFYLALAPALLLPWFFIPALWRGLRPLQRPHTWQTRLILCWIVPVFLAFMMISGKQAHYLIPILPGFFLLAAHGLITRGILNTVSPARLYRGAVLPIGLLLLVMTGAENYAHLLETTKANNLAIQMQGTYARFLILALLALILIGVRVRRAGYTSLQTLRAIMLAHVIAVAGLHFSIAPMLDRYYNLNRFAAALAPYDQAARPIAVARGWHGEVGYLAHLTHGVEVIQTEDMAAWLTQHPNGVLILRHDTDEPPALGHVVYTQAYRSPTKAISLLSASK